MENRNVMIQTAKGVYNFTDEDRILVHEHVFNRFPYWHRIEMEDFVIRELKRIYEKGISVICDLTAYTKPYNYYRIIEESPVNIVTCLGFYTPRYVLAQYKNASAEQTIRSYSRIIEKGIGGKKIKPGILKIAAQKDELNELERKLFFIIARLNKEYGLPIALHAPQNAFSHLNTLLEFGADPRKIFVAHIETSVSNEVEFTSRLSDAKKIIALGSYVQLADFGTSIQSKKCKAATKFMCELINAGGLRHLLLSGDSSWRWKRDRFVVKEFNHGKGKHYTYTYDFTLDLLHQIGIDKSIDHVLLNLNPSELFSTMR